MMTIRHRILSVLGNTELSTLEIAKAVRASLGAVHVAIQHLERDGAVMTRWEPQSKPHLDPSDPWHARRRLVRLVSVDEERAS